jgi:hypothetical protein
MDFERIGNHIILIIMIDIVQRLGDIESESAIFTIHNNDFLSF